ncbi:MAG: NCS2 family permease [Nitrospinae bacterium]|nr:NCS2 family permease [Nitrospinota bacterium]
MGFLERAFGLSTHNTTVATEATAGATTFLTMSYIVFVQPAVLSAAGMDFGAVMLATCLSSAFASILMAFLANYPVALAPAMGHNFFFVFSVCGAVAAGGMGFTWRQALAAVFVSGSIFLFLSLFGFREKVIAAVPESLRYGLAVGVGLLIALLGLEWGGIVVAKPGTLVGLGDITSGPALVCIAGTFTIAALMVMNVRGAILIGILASALVSIAAGYAAFHGVVSVPPSLAPTFLQLDFAGLFAHPQFWMVILIFFFLDLFDTVGTLMGVGLRAGLVDKNGKLPRAERALAADAAGTVIGAALGTSTVTSYIESAAGVAAGGRTGLTALVTALFFILAIFFAPLAQTVGGGYQVPGGPMLYPAIAPSLIVVGSLMLSLVRDIPWDDMSEAFPAYLAIIVTPLALSITEGISVGFIAYSILKTAKGDFFRVHPAAHVLALIFILRYVFLV